MYQRFHHAVTRGQSFVLSILLLSLHLVFSSAQLRAEDDRIIGPRPFGVGIGVFIIALSFVICVGMVMYGILQDKVCKFGGIGVLIFSFFVFFTFQCPRGPATKSIELQLEAVDEEKDWGYAARNVFGIIFIASVILAVWKLTVLHLIVPIRAGDRLPK
eukprot:g3978.t1